MPYQVYPRPVIALNLCKPVQLELFQKARLSIDPVSILRKSISDRHRPVRVADGPMMARCRFT